jgi:hypothetical protein
LIQHHPKEDNLSMPRPRTYLALALLLAAPALADKPRQPPPARSAHTYECKDSHSNELVTIAAEPGDTPATRPDTRLDYFSHGLLPVRVIVTNDSDFAVSLDDARIPLLTADNTPILAATLDDLQRRMFTIKSATGSKIPLPLPIPIPITHGKSAIDKKILADDADFSFATTTVKPHTTVSGYLFYDIEGFNAPPDPASLTHATLELRKVRFLTSGKFLDSFEIPLHPTKQ